MSVITSSRGVELLRQAAEPGKHERQIVNARRGREQQWMGLAEAVSIVVNAEGAYLPRRREVVSAHGRMLARRRHLSVRHRFVG